jgi:adenylate kinase
MQYDTIFLMGPQGSGKGTQAKILAEKLGYYRWDTGSVLREHRDAVTPTGETVGELLDGGHLLTDEQLFGVIGPLITKIPAETGVIFDGIPRRLAQAEWLLNFLKSQGRTKMAAIVLNIPHDESVRRLLKRAEVEGRADDTKEAIEFRLEQYYADTVPMLDYMRTQAAFFEVDGTPSIEEVSASVSKTLGLE